MDGAGGKANTFTVTSPVSTQPLGSKATTEYVVVWVGATLICEKFAPVFQFQDEPPATTRVTVEPLQLVKSGVTEIVNGGKF